MDSFFGLNDSFVTEPFSCPFACFRNKEANALRPVYSRFIADDLIANAWSKTLYFKRQIQDSPVDSSTLYRCIVEDDLSTYKQSMQIKNRRNSLLGVHHGCHSYIVHAGGALFNQLVVRNSADLKPSGNTMARGFTIELEGSIQKLERFGTGSWSISSDFLVQTDCDLYHMKTSGIQDVVDPKFSMSTDPTDIMIEPVQKWVPNFEMACLSGSKHSWSHSFVLSTCEELFSLNCEQGLRSCLTGRGPNDHISIFSGTSNSVPNHGDVPLYVEATAHPQICFLSRGEEVFRKDLREAGRAATLMRSPRRPVTSLCSMRTPAAISGTGHSDPFIVCVQNAILLMDPRFPNKCVAQRPVPGTHALVRRGGLSTEDFFSGEDCRHADIIATADSSGKQVYLHTLSLDGNNGGESMVDQRASLLYSSSISGHELAVSWGTVGYPVIETGGRGGAGVRGMDTLVCDWFSGSRDFISVKKESTEDSGLDEQEEEQSARLNKEAADPDREGSLLVCHQSDRGDVYCQQVRVLHRNNSSFRAPVQLNLPVGVRCVDPAGRRRQDGHDSGNTDYGLFLGDVLYGEDRESHSTFPLTGETFVGSQADKLDSLRTKIVTVNIDNVLENEEESSFKLGHTMKAIKILPARCIKDLRSIIRDTATDIMHHLSSRYCATLWELWRILADKIKTDFSIEELRQAMEGEMCSGGSLEDAEAFLTDTVKENLALGSIDGLRVVEHSVPEVLPTVPPIPPAPPLCQCHVRQEDIFEGTRGSQELPSVVTYMHLQGQISSCGAPTCPLIHTIAYKRKYSLVIASSGLSMSTTSALGPTENSMYRQSDVTSDVIDNLKEMWILGDEGDW